MNNLFLSLNKYYKKPNTLSKGTLYIGKVKIKGLPTDPERLIRIYLPSNYKEYDDKVRFPVIYMMDGKNLFDKYTSYAGEWEVDEIIEKRIENNDQAFIVVGIDSATTGNGREEEMLPDNNNLIEIDGLPLDMPAYGDILGNWIISKLKPEIDKLFHTLPSKDHTAIGGSSMGGLFSFYMGLKYKEIFGFSLCYSPAFCLYQEDYFKEEFEEYEIDSKLGKIYFLVGDIEYENQFVSLTNHTYEALIKKGMNQGKIKYIHDKEGIHHESFWTKYFNDSLNFWYAKKSDNVKNK